MNGSTHPLDAPGLEPLEAADRLVGGSLIPWTKIAELTVPHVMNAVVQDWTDFKRGFSRSVNLWRIAS